MLTLSAQDVAIMRVIRGSCCASVATGNSFSTCSGNVVNVVAVIDCKCARTHTYTRTHARTHTHTRTHAHTHTCAIDVARP